MSEEKTPAEVIVNLMVRIVGATVLIAVCMLLSFLVVHEFDTPFVKAAVTFLIGFGCAKLHGWVSEYMRAEERRDMRLGDLLSEKERRKSEQ